MGKWPMVRLGDVFDLQMGKTPSRDNNMYWDNGIYNWASISDLSSAGKYIETTSEKITDLAVKESGIKIVPENTVLLSFKLSLGKVCISLKSLYTNEAIMALLDKKVYSINIDYIYYLLKNINWDIYTNKAAKGKTLNKGILANIKIPLPPIDIQKNIANTLDKTQEIIDGYKKLLAELDNLIKAVFYKMFGDPVTNEKGLKAAKIKDFFIVKSGSTPNRNCNEYWKDGSIPWIKTTEIKENYIYSSEEYITELAAKECRLTRMPKGTILVAMYGQGQTRGRTAKLMVNATINQACAALVKKNDNINVDFVWHFLMISYEQLRSLGRGGNQPNLNKSLVENFEILIPDISLQTKFADIVTKIEEQKALVKQAITESEHLFNSLMSEYFD